MRIRVQKWGNSFALRIPESFARETALEPGAEVDLTLENGRLVITPLPKPVSALDELLAQITAENLHLESETGPGVGDEAW